MKAKITAVDLNRLAKKFSRFEGKLRQDVADDLAESVLQVRNLSIQKLQSGTTDKGGLAGGFYIEKRRNNGLLWQVGNNVRYAPFIEFGTGSKVNLTELKDAGLPESYAMQFKGKGIKAINIQPQPYFFPSVNEETQRLYKKLKRTITDAGRKF